MRGLAGLGLEVGGGRSALGVRTSKWGEWAPRMSEGVMRRKAKAGTEKKGLPVLPRGGGRGGVISWFRQCACLCVCVQTWLRSGLVFALLHPGHRVTSFSVGVQCNGVCSTKEQPGQAVSARRLQLTAAGLRLCFSPFGPGFLLWLIAHQCPFGGNWASHMQGL